MERQSKRKRYVLKSHVIVFFIHELIVLCCLCCLCYYLVGCERKDSFNLYPQTVNNLFWTIQLESKNSHLWHLNATTTNFWYLSTIFSSVVFQIACFKHLRFNILLSCITKYNKNYYINMIVVKKKLKYNTKSWCTKFEVIVQVFFKKNQYCEFVCIFQKS